MTSKITTTNGALYRSLSAHKSTCGRLAIIAGSDTYTGAAILATRAALRCGVGLVVVFSVRSVTTAIQQSCPEAIAISVSNAPYLSHHDWPELLLLMREHRIDGLVLGPGLGRHSDTISLVNQILFEEWPDPLPCVIDADALYAINQNDLPRFTHISGILTPHPGEFEQLTQQKITDAQHNLTTATDGHHHVIVLKGAPTWISQHQNESYQNRSGNPGMAVAGMGDALSGCIGALMVQGLSSFDASCLGTYCHGVAGDIAFETYHIGLTPSDVIDALPEALAPFVVVGE